MKTFKFTCKQNQVAQVVKLLFGFTTRKPSVKLVNGFPVVSVVHNLTNRKIDKFLFMNNVPGANPRKNKYKIVKCDLWQLSSKIPANTYVKWVSYTGKLKIIKWNTYRTYCSCCDFQTRIEDKSGKVLN